MSDLLHVSFHGDTIDCIRHDDGETYVSIKRFCENLCLNERGQMQRLERVPWATACKMHAVGSDGKSREMSCLNIKALPMFLGTIKAHLVKDPFLRQKLELYQKECAEVLFRHFSGQGGNSAMLARLDRICELLESRQQEALAQLEQRMEDRLQAHDRAVETRLREQLPLALRNQSAPTATIDRSQIFQLKTLIKTAMVNQGIDSFQVIHGRLRSHIPGLAGYKLMTQAQYPDALAFLQQEAAKGPQTFEERAYQLAMSLN